MPPGVARPSIPPYLYPEEDHSPMALAAMALYDALLTQFGLFQFTNPLITVPAHHPAAPAAGHISFWYLIVEGQFATDTQLGLAHDFAHGIGDYAQYPDTAPGSLVPAAPSSTPASAPPSAAPSPGTSGITPNMMALQSRLSGGPWNPEPYDHWLAEQFEMCEEADREREEAAAAAAAEADREREEAAAAEAEAREHELLLYHEGEPGEALISQFGSAACSYIHHMLAGFTSGAVIAWT